MSPGATQFTVTLCGARSCASARVSPTSPIFAATTCARRCRPGVRRQAADVDDGSLTGRDQVRQRRVAAQVCPIQGRRQRLAPLTVVEVGERHFAAYRGVVHQDVETAEVIDGRGDERSRLIGIGNVAHLHGRAATGGADFLRDLLGSRRGCPRIDDDRRACLREGERNGASDVAGAAGDDCHPSRQLLAHAGSRIAAPRLAQFSS